MSGAAEIAAKLTALAERCEAATGGDARTMRALGREVLLACGKGYVSPLYTWHNPVISLDAAMTLAKRYGGEVTFFKDGTAKAFVWQPYPLAVDAKAATPALALCAAALRARAHLSRERGE